MHLIVDLVSANRIVEIPGPLHKEGIATQGGDTDRTDRLLLVDEEDGPQALEILKRPGIKVHA